MSNICIDWYYGLSASIMLCILVAWILLCGHTVLTLESPPHIIFILADDLGWYDVGFHGSGDVKTPNIDALAYTGLILNKYYVAPICTPTRSALMTGKYPIHTGMQHGVIKGAEPWGLPLNETILPQYLQKFGYKNYIVGKWHLGHYMKKYTPTYRGFVSHVGFWTGHQDYYDHTAVEWPHWGMDMRRDMDPAWDLHGRYSTDVFTTEAVNIIEKHNESQPLFLYLAHAAVHSANPYNPLPVSDENVVQFEHIKDYKRRRFAAMLKKLDESIGAVVDALKQHSMLEKSVIIFSTDNGGPAAGFNQNSASNFPLKGVKNTLWEGGVRGTGLLWTPKLLNPGRVYNGAMSIVDWLPTLLHLTGESNAESYNFTDGIDMWESLNFEKPSPRRVILHNIDDIYGAASITVNDWKIVKGTTYNGAWDNWYGSSSWSLPYDANEVINSVAGLAVKSLGMSISVQSITTLRNESRVNCPHRNTILTRCQPFRSPCLFNIHDDPCEYNNLAELFPDILKRLKEELNKWNATAVAPRNVKIDNRANPAFWDHTWNNFGDYPSPVSREISSSL